MNNLKIIKNKLTIDESVQFINTVVHAFFSYDENGEVINYTPYLGKIALKSNFIKYYTDYNYSDDSDKVYDDICNVNIKDYYEDISLVQYLEIEASIYEKVSVIRDNYINSQNGITRLLNSISDVLDSINISDLDFKKIENFMSKFDESGINARSIVDAYLNSNQYNR